MFFNEEGLLNVDELVVNNESFRTIMEDGVITESEIEAQSEKVFTILRNMENKFSEEQLVEVKNLIAESCVLYAVYNYYSLQDLEK